MARPRTALGTFGKIALTGQVKDAAGRWTRSEAGQRPERWRARTKFRDRDGVSRDVEAFGATKAKAEHALRLKLADRQHVTQNNKLRADMTVLAAAKVWLEQVDRSELADGTKRQYAANVATYLEGAFKDEDLARVAKAYSIKGLTLREVNRVSIIEGYLQGVADAHGEGAARAARKVLSGVLALAVRYDVLPHNAAKDVRPAKASSAKSERVRDTRRALTKDERAHLMAVADADERAGRDRMDIADLIAFMAGTGVRIGEARLCLQWTDVDFERGTVHVRGTKTASADRVLTLPEWLSSRLLARAKVLGSEGLVFPSPGRPAGINRDSHRPWDKDNLNKEVRKLLDAADLPWATSHSLRRTVASLMDAAGLSVAEAADQLGHANPAMTASVYLGRRAGGSRAAEVL
ncbi:site-specific integrase [Nocardioides sp. BP30]|uniref:site-specific integrase n=1 Tax=Nocardioides sp. BP30 TaxID=3036374 RepID=UPI002468611B|nr:site-specific integrase [Nocardioides sp. BP30]WGL51597.1 site-specific integrase [Nocardioides sp. BP30]